MHLVDFLILIYGDDIETDGSIFIIRTDNKMIQLKQAYLWGRLHGKVYGHPNYPDGTHVCPGKPTKYDSDTMIFTSFSGKEYEIFPDSEHERSQIDEWMKQMVSEHVGVN